ncbi:cnot11, partial [Symbiodinium sp. CCMP2456]
FSYNDWRVCKQLDSFTLMSVHPGARSPKTARCWNAELLCLWHVVCTPNQVEPMPWNGAGDAELIVAEDQLLTQAQRLVSYYLLYDIYRNDRGTERETATTPFVPLVVEMLETSYDGVERKFLLQFLSNPPKDLHKQTVNQFVQSCDPNDIPALPDLDMVRSMHQDGAPAVSASAALGIRPVIKEASDERYWVPSPLPPNSLGEDVEDVTGTESIELNPEELTMLSLEPCWARPVPPLLEPTVDEVFWLTPPHLLSEPLWDYTMCADTSLGSEVKELIAKAVKTQLQPQQIQIISDGLAQDAKLVYHCGLTPKKLPELVENNPQIAIEVLLKLMGGSQISGYFNALVNMEMSLHSMEATAMAMGPEASVGQSFGSTRAL